MTPSHAVYAPDGRLLAHCTTREAQAAAMRLLGPRPLRVVSRDPLMGVVVYVREPWPTPPSSS